MFFPDADYAAGGDLRRGGNFGAAVLSFFAAGEVFFEGKTRNDLITKTTSIV